MADEVACMVTLCLLLWHLKDLTDLKSGPQGRSSNLNGAIILGLDTGEKIQEMLTPRPAAWLPLFASDKKRCPYEYRWEHPPALIGAALRGYIQDHS